MLVAPNTGHVPRTTCLYCEQRGVTTALIPFAHWAVCPVCAPEWAAAATPPDPDPLLLTKGQPGWVGRKAA